MTSRRPSAVFSAGRPSSPPLHQVKLRQYATEYAASRRGSLTGMSRRYASVSSLSFGLCVILRSRGYPSIGLDVTLRSRRRSAARNRGSLLGALWTSQSPIGPRQFQSVPRTQSVPHRTMAAPISPRSVHGSPSRPRLVHCDSSRTPIGPRRPQLVDNGSTAAQVGPHRSVVASVGTKCSTAAPVGRRSVPGGPSRQTGMYRRNASVSTALSCLKPRVNSLSHCRPVRRRIVDKYAGRINTGVRYGVCGATPELRTVKADRTSARPCTLQRSWSWSAEVATQAGASSKNTTEYAATRDLADPNGVRLTIGRMSDCIGRMIGFGIESWPRHLYRHTHAVFIRI